MNKTKLYFIPGTMCDQLIWSKVWPSIEQQFELIHLPVPDEDNIENVLSSLLPAFQEDNVNLIGFSMGGYLATCLAEFRPNMVNNLLVISNSPCALPKDEILQRKQTISWLERFQYRGLTEQKAFSMLAANNVDRESLKGIMETMEQNLGYDRLIRQLKATSQRIDKSQFIASKQTNITFCYGDQDKLVDTAWLVALAQEHDLQALEVKSCGHMLPLEQPDRLVEVIHNTFKSC